MVGYTSTGFIIRNSWGTGWGDKGFAYASNAYAKKAFTEAAAKAALAGTKELRLRKFETAKA